MTALIIIGALLLILTVVLLLPISFDLKFDEQFFLKVKVAGIRVYEIEPEKDIPDSGSPPPNTESDKKAEKQEKNFFDKLKEKLGFTGAVKEIFRFVSELIKKVKKYLKHIYFRKLFLEITVATDNAAKTAIEYGALCTSVYPVLTLIDTVVNVRMKQINVKTDFNKTEPDFKAAFTANLRIIYILLIAKAAFSEYNKFKSRNEL